MRDTATHSRLTDLLGKTVVELNVFQTISIKGDISLKCFIAMAFGREDTDKAYKKLIAPTLRHLKIIPVRVDRIEHLEDINNKIMAELKKCDFTLADLTYARPSVYFEAGYADREVPVIYTCKSDHLSGRPNDPYGNFRVHFDLRMKNIIPWSSPADSTFSKRLERRVRLAVLPTLGAPKDLSLKKLTGDEYVQFGAKSGHIKTDALAIMKELHFKHVKDISVSYEMYTSHISGTILSAMNRIGIRELGFSRSYRFLVRFLNQWYPTGGYHDTIAVMRAMHDSNEYKNSGHNNIWVEVSYGRFRETFLRNWYSSSSSRGFTVIPINPNLSYLGHDRTTFQFRAFDKRSVSRFRHFSSLIRDKNLSNYTVLEKMLEISEKARSGSPEKAAIDKELRILGSEPAIHLDFGYSLRVGESSPGFVIHNVRTKAALKSYVSTMLDWIADNGHWI